MTMLRIVLAFFLTFGAPALARAGDFTVPPVPDHRVTDRAAALSPATRLKLESELRDFEKSTGDQVIVFIDQTTGGVPLEDWTAQTAHTWKIGHAKADNGAVLFLFVRDHRVRIETGYGLEGSLTDADSKRIIDSQIVPQMKRGNVDAAVEDGVNAMLAQISPTFKGASPPPDSSSSADDMPDWAAALIVIVLFAIFIVGPIVLIALVLARRKQGGFGKAFHDVWFWSPSGGSAGSNYREDDREGGSSGGGDFSAGGGDFGGGGASGSW